MKLNFLVGLGLAAALSGCATTGGMPRVNAERGAVIAAPEDAVKTAVAGDLTSKGFLIKQDSQFVMTFDKPSSDFAANLLLGSSMNPTVNNRAIFQFVGDNPTSVTWHTYIVTNPGTGLEQLTDTTNSPNNDPVQALLVSIKAQLESGPPPKPAKPAGPKAVKVATGNTGL